jgi:hypothetical protein
MFETSAETAKLDAALAKAQGEIEAASKDKVNPAFRSRYADLTAVWEVCRPALAKHGISVTQWPIHADDARLHIVTRLAHGGEWMRAHFSIPVTKQDAQGYGSAMTYAKRYSLAAALGVVADEDDDGNAASHPRNGKQPSSENSNERATIEQVQALTLLIGSQHIHDKEREHVLQRIADGITKLEAIDLSEDAKRTIQKREAKAGAR